MQKRYPQTSAVPAILFALLFHALLSSGNAIASNEQRPVKVGRVHDGDTITVILNRKRERVRLIGIDAPEIRQRPWGILAQKHLEKLLYASNGKIVLEYDVEKRDKYGRLLCYIFTPDEKMINIQMIKDGYAMLLTIPPNVKYVDELKAAQTEARQFKRGIWGSKGLKENPGDYRKRHR